MAPNATSSSANLPHLQIVDRLVEYPLVNNALGYANQGYAALKSSNSVITQTLDRAEKSFHLVVTATVVPVLTQLEQPSMFKNVSTNHSLHIILIYFFYHLFS